MTIALDDVFEAAGFHADDARTRAALAAHVLRAHEHRVGMVPDGCWFVPGRIEVFGKHTDYAGGRTLIGAVPRGMAIAVSARADRIVRVVDMARRQTAAIDATDRASEFFGWANYAAVVVRRLAANFPHAALGADITLASDLPSASGMSSSSVLVVAIATALVSCSGLERTGEWADTIRGPIDRAGYFAAIEAGADYGPLAGVKGVGTHGGSEDHTAILTCRAGHLSAYRFVPIAHLGNVAVPDEWRFVVVVSGIAADKTGSARDRYNFMSATARSLVEIWNRHRTPHCRVLADVLATAPSAESELSALLDDEAGAYDADILRRRLLHFIREDARVERARVAIEHRDVAALGQLAIASQHDAEELLRNQIPQTSALARFARETGAFASTSFGAGFGGSVWALVPAADAEPFSRQWIDAYRSAYPTVAAAAIVMRPGQAAMEVPRSDRH